VEWKYYHHKTMDLIGVKDRKCIDDTATHLHRDVGDLLRYAAVVTVAEPVQFGAQRVLAAPKKRVQVRALCCCRPIPMSYSSSVHKLLYTNRTFSWRLDHNERLDDGSGRSVGCQRHLF
jgi:hypothetical protein